jgi:hypothetical protein
MSEIDRNDVIKYRLSFHSPRNEPEPATNENETPTNRTQTAKSHNYHDYSYADNLIMRVRLNRLKNEAKIKAIEENKTKHIMLQTSPGKVFNREQQFSKIKNLFGSSQKYQTI